MGRDRSPARQEDSSGGIIADLGRRFRAAALTGVVAGAGVWGLFAVLPFLRAGSGGAGAALATFVAVLLLRRD
jgi:hypothetical protein